MVSSIFLFTTVVRSLPPITNVIDTTMEDQIMIPSSNSISIVDGDVLCVNSTKGAPMRDIRDCLLILQQFESSPLYRTNRVWVGHGRTATPEQIRTPAGNQNGTCLIAVHARDPMKTDVFTLRDVALKAQLVMGNCNPDPGKLKYGGITPVGHGRSFRVSVEPKYSLPAVVPPN